MKCTFCGKDLPEEAVFCYECGNRLNIENVYAENNSTQKKMPKGLKIGIIAAVSVVLIAIIATTIILITRNDSKEKQIEHFLEDVFNAVYVNDNYEKYFNAIYPSLPMDSYAIESFEDEIYEMQSEIGYIKSIDVNILNVKTAVETYKNNTEILENLNEIKQKSGIKEIYVVKAEILIEGNTKIEDLSDNGAELVVGKVKGKWKVIDVFRLMKELNISNATSEKKTDQKNADELASQLQTCITEYDTEYVTLGSVTVTWDEDGAKCDNATFQDMVNQNITSSAQSKVDSSYATAEITYSDETKVYSIVVELGEAQAVK